MNIVLASGSPRRREILTQIGAVFTVRPAQGEEVITTDVPEQVVAELSAQKANEVAAGEPDGTLIIGADTIVSFEGEILGKPKDEKDAVRMLTSLAGQTHQVYTGVTAILLLKGDRKETAFVERTDVTLYPMTAEEITAYVSSGEPLDKAGAYAVQGLFARYIRGLHGDFYNVMGLPVARLSHELMALGVDLTERRETHGGV